MRIHSTPKLTAVLSGHGRNRAYLHRFKLREEATCICGKEDQTMDHILFNCIKTREQREILKRRINKLMKFKDNKQELITKHWKVYSEYVESIDFDQLQQDEQ
jgi:hypothetical protein